MVHKHSIDEPPATRFSASCFQYFYYFFWPFMAKKSLKPRGIIKKKRFQDIRGQQRSSHVAINFAGSLLSRHVSSTELGDVSGLADIFLVPSQIDISNSKENAHVSFAFPILKHSRPSRSYQIATHVLDGFKGRVSAKQRIPSPTRHWLDRWTAEPPRVQTRFRAVTNQDGLTVEPVEPDRPWIRSIYISQLKSVWRGQESNRPNPTLSSSSSQSFVIDR